jgi:hypothetical protein
MITDVELESNECNRLAIVKYSTTSKKEEKKNLKTWWFSFSSSFPKLVDRFRALTFEQVRELATQGDADAMRVIKFLRCGGQRGGTRSWKEAELIYNQIPTKLQSSVLESAKFIDGKSISHKIPRSKAHGHGMSLRSSGNSNNVVIEEKTLNIARGNVQMSRAEYVQNAIKNNASSISNAAKNGALVGAAVSTCVHGYEYYNGNKTFTEAAQGVVKDTLVSGLSSGLIATVSLVPVVGPFVVPTLVLKSLLYDTGLLTMATERLSRKGYNEFQMFEDNQKVIYLTEHGSIHFSL